MRFSTLMLLALAPLHGGGLMDAGALEAVLAEVSGDAAKHHIEIMAPYERLRPVSEYTGDFIETRYMTEKMREYGFANVTVEKFPGPADLWRADSGELWLEGPQRERIASAADVAASLAPGTGTVDARAELVAVGAGTRESDYAGKDVRGKIVLVTAPIEEAIELAALKHGAIGLVYYNDDPGQRHPEQIRWQRLTHLGVPPPGRPLFGFAVPAATGARLRAMLDEGKRVVLHATAKTQVFPGKMEAISGEIPGGPFTDDKFIFIGHLFERITKQGANDNLSGPAAELEIGRALIRLQKEGRIPKFRRPVRFLWVFETAGTEAYLRAHPEEARKWKAGINMDMVGEGLADTGSVFHIAFSPHSQPHFINDVAREIGELGIFWNNDAFGRTPGGRYSQLAQRIVSPAGSRDAFSCDFPGFDSGSDGALLNSAAHAIPTVYFEAWPDDYNHSNQDVPIHADATQLRRVAFMGAVIAAFYGTSTPETLTRALPGFVTRAGARLAQEQARAAALLGATDPDLPSAYRLAQVIAGEAHEREAAALESLSLLAKGNAGLIAQIRAEAETLRSTGASLAALGHLYQVQCRLRGIKETPAALTALEQKLSRMTPVVTKRIYHPAGCRPENSILTTDAAAYELFNFTDGRRSIYQVWRKLYAEFGSIPLEDVDEFFRLQIQAGNAHLN